jgi:DNA-binding response OmpR family regulator
MNGVEFLGFFKKQHGENTYPIIMLTRQGSEEDAVMALKSGAHDYLSKNGLTPEALNRSIENAIEKVNLHKKLENWTRVLFSWTSCWQELSTGFKRRRLIGNKMEFL